MACIWAALPDIDAQHLWSIALPNRHNIVFTAGTVLRLVLAVAYLPGGAFLISHMLSQRRRELGGGRDTRVHEL